MNLLDNSMVKLEFMPGKPGEQPAADAQNQAPAAKDKAQQKTGATADSAQKTAGSTASAAQEKGQGVKEQAAGTAQGWSETAQHKAQGVQEQAGQYQSQASDSLKGYGDSFEQTGHSYVQSTTDAANAAAKNNLPEGAQSYAGSAVAYGSNFATGTVGTLGGGVKDLGDTVGNAVSA